MFEDDVSSAADKRADVDIKCHWKGMQPILKKNIYIYMTVIEWNSTSFVGKASSSDCTIAEPAQIT